jgi:glycerol-3-phosphate dehydrogenase
MKPTVGIIGTGKFGLALRDAFQPLFGSKISKIAAWEGRENQPDWMPDILILAIPSSAKNGNRLAILDYIDQFPTAQVIVTSKGEKALQIFCKKIEIDDLERCFTLSGPNISDQITHTPTATVLAGYDFSEAEKLAETLDGDFLHVIPSGSPEIVQRGGMLKNFFVYELGKVWDLLGTPMAKFEATIFALRAGFESIDQFAPAEEDRAEFFGISGLGDLLLCLDIFPGATGSRNFRAGKMKGANKSDTEILNEFWTLEGMSLSNAFHLGIRRNFSPVSKWKTSSISHSGQKKFRRIRVQI